MGQLISAIGIECRIDDEFINSLIALLNHPETSVCVKAERAFLKRLEGGCQVPIAAHATVKLKNKNSKFEIAVKRFGREYFRGQDYKRAYRGEH